MTNSAWRRAIAPLVGGAVLVALLAACGGAGTSSSATPSSAAAVSGEPTRDQLSAALNTFIGFEVKGQWGRVWDQLVPTQQAAIPKDKYLTCKSGESGVGTVDGVNVTDSYHEQTTPPGSPAPIDSIAVTFDASLNGNKQTSTVHEYVVEGQLLFSLDDSTFNQCSA